MSESTLPDLSSEELRKVFGPAGVQAKRKTLAKQQAMIDALRQSANGAQQIAEMRNPSPLGAALGGVADAIKMYRARKQQKALDPQMAGLDNEEMNARVGAYGAIQQSLARAQAIRDSQGIPEEEQAQLRSPQTIK